MANRPQELQGLVHRAVRAWQEPGRRRQIRQRGMRVDWSWTEPADRHVELYRQLVAAQS